MIPKKLQIQHELSRIQHRRGYLPADELRSLSARAAALGEPIPLHRLHEVASFFPHYRLDEASRAGGAGLPRHGLPPPRRPRCRERL